MLDKYNQRKATMSGMTRPDSTISGGNYNPTTRPVTSQMQRQPHYLQYLDKTLAKSE